MKAPQSRRCHLQRRQLAVDRHAVRLTHARRRVANLDSVDAHAGVGRHPVRLAARPAPGSGERLCEAALDVGHTHGSLYEVFGVEPWLWRRAMREGWSERGDWSGEEVRREDVGANPGKWVKNDHRHV